MTWQVNLQPGALVCHIVTTLSFGCSTFYVPCWFARENSKGAQTLAQPHPCGRPGGCFWILASDWPCSSLCGYLGTEPVMKQALWNSALQINRTKLFFFFQEGKVKDFSKCRLEKSSKTTSLDSAEGLLRAVWVRKQRLEPDSCPVYSSSLFLGSPITDHCTYLTQVAEHTASSNRC